ncbi:MAG: flavodoxin family protein, partial [Oscillospiraceae bacterium]|nr:flavodoxin family protein [Oscillospiraceae bacterium]
MLVLAVKGSPRENGKTNRFIDEFLRGATDAGHETKVYNVGNMAIKGCQSCYACKERVTDCVIDDELKDYFANLHNAYALIVGAPNYASNVCGQIVSFMNRHYCLIDKDRNVHIPAGIKVVGVFAQGQQDKDKYMDMYRWFMSDFERRHMELLDIVVATSSDDEQQLLVQAYEMGKAL